PSDYLSLSVSTLFGADTVNIHDTQPDQTYVSTGGGDDKITVGDGSTLGLDYIEGPLVVNAGAGHNQLTFDEHYSPYADIATLTTNQGPAGSLNGLPTALLGSISRSLSGPLGYLLRYKGEALPSSPVYTEVVNPYPYRYPLGITFLASGGGDF